MSKENKGLELGKYYLVFSDLEKTKWVIGKLTKVSMKINDSIYFALTGINYCDRFVNPLFFTFDKNILVQEIFDEPRIKWIKECILKEKFISLLDYIESINPEQDNKLTYKSTDFAETLLNLVSLEKAKAEKTKTDEELNYVLKNNLSKSNHQKSVLLNVISEANVEMIKLGYSFTDLIQKDYPHNRFDCYSIIEFPIISQTYSVIANGITETSPSLKLDMTGDEFDFGVVTPSGDFLEIECVLDLFKILEVPILEELRIKNNIKEK